MLGRNPGQYFVKCVRSNTRSQYVSEFKGIIVEKSAGETFVSRSLPSFSLPIHIPVTFYYPEISLSATPGTSPFQQVKILTHTHK